MKEGKHKKESVFELNGGMPPLGQALPLAFQHIVAMIVGCVTPAIIIAGVAGLSGEDKVIIEIQIDGRFTSESLKQKLLNQGFTIESIEQTERKTDF